LFEHKLMLQTFGLYSVCNPVWIQLHSEPG